jgi:succinate-semialdehyde dehydrogenase / glutarate-semialdehyde dehydrogenase
MNIASDVVGATPTGLLVGGDWRSSRGGGTFPVEDPATGGVLCEVADATVEDGMTALDAADAASGSWAGHPSRERAELLRRAYEMLMRQQDDLALLITLEMGKPLAEARAEVAYGAEFFRWFSEEAARIAGHYSASPDGKGRIMTIRQPVGPCLFITPWNFPLAMGTRKIGPAIAAGCTMVVKPAQQTPLTMLKLAEILTEAGLPEGVLNVVTTTSSGRVMEPLIRDPRLRKLSFTGSTAVGRTLIEQSAEQVLRVSMELGGNAPFIVFEDADLDAAVQGALVAKMRNMGESCVAANRFYVFESVAEEFASRLAARMGALTVGHGTDPKVDVGLLIDDRARTDVHALVQEAMDLGASAVVGGTPLDGAGYFYEPTVLADVIPEARLVREEIFGPVAPIVTFTDVDEVVAMANATEYGLVAYIYTENLRRAMQTIEALEVGMVGLNRGMVSNPAGPFGGVKHSGLGREGGREGIDEYLETKYVALDL